MRILAIAVTFIFLFAFGAGEAYCFCSDSDDCCAVVNFAAQSGDLLSDQAPDSVQLNNSLKKDCCADCFKSMNTAMLTGSAAELYDLELVAVLSGRQNFEISRSTFAMSRGIRAPPEFWEPGNKTYLIKQVFLI